MSGQLIGGIIGAIISVFVPGAGPAIGWAIGSLVGGLLIGKEPTKGPRLSDLKVQSSEYGRPIPIIYGDMGLHGNVIWAADLIEEASDVGGKGGGGGVTVYSYYGTFAVGFCEGKHTITKLWAGLEKRLIYDAERPVALPFGLALYNGSEDQTPDPTMESHLGVGQVPAYRGLVYAVFTHFPLKDDGNTLPIIFAEFGTTETPVDEWVYPWTAVHPQQSDSQPGDFLKLSSALGAVTGTEQLRWQANRPMVMIGTEIWTMVYQNGWTVEQDAELATPTGITNATSGAGRWGKCLQIVDRDTGNVKQYIDMPAGYTIDTEDNSQYPNFIQYNEALNEVWLFTFDTTPSTRIPFPHLIYRWNASTRTFLGRTSPVDPTWTRPSATDTNNISLTPYYNKYEGKMYAVVYAAIWSVALGSSTCPHVVRFTDSGTIDKTWQLSLGGNDWASTAGLAVQALVFTSDGSKYCLAQMQAINPALTGNDAQAYIYQWDTDPSDPHAAPAVADLTSDPLMLNGHWKYGQFYDMVYNPDAQELIVVSYHECNSSSPEYPSEAPEVREEWLWAFDLASSTLTRRFMLPRYVNDTVAAAVSSAKGSITNRYYGGFDYQQLPRYYYDTYRKALWTAGEFYFYGVYGQAGANPTPYNWVAYNVSTGAVIYRRENTPWHDPQVTPTGDGAFIYWIEGSTRFAFSADHTWALSQQYSDQDSGSYYVWYPDHVGIWRLPGGVGDKVVHLWEVVTDLSERAGLTADQLDVAELTDLVDGYAIAKETTVREAIDVLRPVYFFDGAESQGKVKYRKRGGATDFIIDPQYLGAYSQGQTTEANPLATVRKMNQDLPNEVQLTYMQKARKFDTNTLYFRRLAQHGGTTYSMSVSMQFPDAKAAQVAYGNLAAAWLERLSYQFQLPYSYACQLEPMDKVQIGGYTMRITKAVDTVHNAISFEAVRDQTTTADSITSLYNPVVPQQITETPTVVQTPVTVPTTRLELM